MSRGSRIPTLVLGGTGYVAGELLRLIAAHPRLELAAAVSDSKPGERLAAAFPHLAPVYPDTAFVAAGEADPYDDKAIAADAATNRDEFRLLVQGMESGIDTFRRDSIQEEGDEIVKGIHGPYSNVVGLPIERLKEVIENWND